MTFPDVWRADIVDQIHGGHQSLTKRRERANTSVCGLASHLKSNIKSSPVRCFCEMKHTRGKEPLIPTSLPV